MAWDWFLMRKKLYEPKNLSVIIVVSLKITQLHKVVKC
jgi:hypothetical protein